MALIPQPVDFYGANICNGQSFHAGPDGGPEKVAGEDGPPLSLFPQGCEMRFGLVHVDFSTLKRTPKDSAWWHRDVIR